MKVGNRSQNAHLAAVICMSMLLLILLPRKAACAEEYVEWLKERSMLLQAQALMESFSGNGRQWQHPYALARPDDFLDCGSVWFSAYPGAIIGRRGDSVLKTLGDSELLRVFATIGIEAVHTGPLKLAGSLRGKQYHPTIDGHFDRIELTINPDFGTEKQYKQMVGNARAQGIAIIGDLVPGHTGKGPDFRLAERNVEGFPGLFSMVEIRPAEWSLLPPVPAGQDSINLSLETVQSLMERGYIVGPLDAVVFARPGIKVSSWAATNVVTGVDGTDRRWVYLHIFKRGQPSLNWLDPSFGAQRMLTGDILHSLTELGTRGLRLDANMFLGIGPAPEDRKGWLIGHPLSDHATKTIAMTIRKFGGYSFQELNTSLDKILATMDLGPELSYDFTTRPSYLYALVTGDAGPSRLILREMLSYGVRPMRMVHALQNHDELMLETTHLRIHGDKIFTYEGTEVKGSALFERITQQPLTAATGECASYNEKFAMSPGICSTLAGLAAAVFKIADLDKVSAEQVAEIRKFHLAAAAFNALQPGAFALSGWDMVGALPVPRESVRDLLADNDCRWLNRGAYDLLGADKGAAQSAAGLPRAIALYGSLPDQLKDSNSFVFRLREMLRIRKNLQIAQGRMLAVPEVSGPGVVLFINELPPQGKTPSRLQVSAINFGRSSVTEVIRDDRFQNRPARTVFSTLRGPVSEQLSINKNMPVIRLEPFEAVVILKE